MLNKKLNGVTAPPSDPYFENVSLLLQGDGTNGAQNNTFLDSSTNNFTITRNGNTTQGSFSPYGPNWSNYFDGTGDYLSVPDNTAFNLGTGDFTIECWVYINTAKLAGLIDRRGSPAAAPWAWYIYANNTISFYDGTNYTTTSTVPNNTWAHVAVTRSSGTLRHFINGVLANTPVSVTTNLTGTGAALIASLYDASSSLNGYMSNFRLIKGTALYTSNFTPSTTPLTAVSGTSLLTCQSNRFIDNSSNNFTLTVNGNTSMQRFSPFNPTAAYSAATIGGSGYFDGSGDYLSSPLNSVNLRTAFTFEGWCYLTTATGFSMLAGSTTTSAGDALYLQVVSGTVYFGAPAANIITFSSSLLPLNSWFHCACTFDGTTYRVFINGTSVGTSTTLLPNSTLLSMTVGARAAGSPTAYTTGYISNFRVVKGTAVYTSNFTPPTAPLTAITNTSLLCNFTNAGIPDAAMMNDLETVGNAQVSTSVVKYGTGSLAFDGTGDYLTFPAGQNTAFGTGDFTVEMWVNLTSAQSGVSFYLIDTRNSGQTTNWALLKSATNTLDWFTGSSSLTGPSFTTTGSWIHVAYCRSGTTSRMFINGSVTNTFTDSTNYSVAPTIAYIASRYSAAEQLNGYIDDLRITKGYARYTTNFTPPTAALPTY
jgi:Concanavalin A-like lectin/glucanases superfamily